jgi:prepilin-type N-terminal cleavage/methylation domain-containing protein
MIPLKHLKDRKSFTLLEVMVAICIFSMMASISGWQIFRMISDYRFNNQVTDCLSSLQNAQSLALVYQTDLSFEIFLENDSYYYRIHSHEPFPPSILNKEKKYSLSAVEVCTYNKEIITNKKWEIFSNGLIYPRGRIYFAKQEKKGLWIDLQKGFLINCVKEKPIKNG